MITGEIVSPTTVKGERGLFRRCCLSPSCSLSAFPIFSSAFSFRGGVGSSHGKVHPHRRHYLVAHILVPRGDQIGGGTNPSAIEAGRLRRRGKAFEPTALTAPAIAAKPG